MFSVESMERIGQALGGLRWRSDVSRLTGFSKGYLTRVMLTDRAAKGAREASPKFLAELRVAMINRIDELRACLLAAGLPHQETEEFMRAQELLKEAVILLDHDTRVVKD